jgi:ubiquinone/menaquinone biosynthesis C-methylase UbiE
MPFAGASFDLVICQAAFKNFSRPQAAVNEMFRVLRPGGIARIQDMRRDAGDAAIRDEVRNMNLGFFRAYMTRSALRSLRRRAYTVEQFRQFARASPFGDGEIKTSGIGLELRLRRPQISARG